MAKRLTNENITDEVLLELVQNGDLDFKLDQNTGEMMFKLTKKGVAKAKESIAQKGGLMRK